MKKILIAVLSLTLLNSAFALDTAKLRMKISGAVKDNRYFMYVGSAGCLSVYAAQHGKEFPLDAGTVKNVEMVNMGNLRGYNQTIPSSCNVTVNKNQTLTVSGKLVTGRDNKVEIHNLSCSVA